jgi:Oxidoreductase molybdopterin binding domain
MNVESVRFVQFWERDAGGWRRRPEYEVCMAVRIFTRVQRAKLDPHRPFQRFPLAPHQMRDRQTRTEDAFVLCHLGVVRVESTEWSLSIDGLVERPRTLRFDDLLRYPKTEVTSVHQCCGSPFARPSNPSWRTPAALDPADLDAAHEMLESPPADLPLDVVFVDVHLGERKKLRFSRSKE